MVAQHRPADFSNFIGQRQVCDNLAVAIEAAQSREEPLDHILFSGPAGLGKTTLCNIIVNAMGTQLFQTNGGLLKKPNDLIGSLTRLQTGDFMFIDEIHRIPMVVEEYLYTAMEDFAIDSIAANGAAIRIELNRFTLLGATTREGMLSEPLLHRFGILCRLMPYSPDDLVTILRRVCELRGIEITHNAAMYIAERSRGTPRLVLRYLRRVSDYAREGVIDLDVARSALGMLGVFEGGLTQKDVALLKALYRSEHPMGLGTLSLMVHENKDTIENVLEPHLMRCGLIQRTARGRIITGAGREFLEDFDG